MDFLFNNDTKLGLVEKSEKCPRSLLENEIIWWGENKKALHAIFPPENGRTMFLEICLIYIEIVIAALGWSKRSF